MKITNGGLQLSVDGCLAVPQGPGLGVDPDPDVIEKLRVR
jgi:L-alanine-DL-glutamate epimerase-like enolase superfamily enzyme